MTRPYRTLSLLPGTLLLGATVALNILAAAACSEPPAEDPLNERTNGGVKPPTGVGAGGASTGVGGTTTGPGGSNVGGASGGLGGAPAGGSTAVSLPGGHPKPGETYPAFPGYTLWVVEEFEQPLDLDSDPLWTWSDGGLAEGQVRFAKEQVSFADGKMRITVGPKDAAITTQSCSHAEATKVFSKPLLSGEVRSRHNIFRYGRYEVRLKAPSVDPTKADAWGNFISTLFVFRTPKFQDWREIDIEVTGTQATPLTMNLIYGDNEPTWRAEIQEVVSTEVGFDPRGDFHDYAFEWLPDSVTWFVDGKEVRKNTAADGGLPIPEKSAKIMMNLWVFGPSAAFGGPNIEDNRYPFTSEYEWFRFYKWDGDTDYPCATLDGACRKAGDEDVSSNNPCDGIPQTGDRNGAALCTAECL